MSSLSPFHRFALVLRQKGWTKTKTSAFDRPLLRAAEHTSAVTSRETQIKQTQNPAAHLRVLVLVCDDGHTRRPRKEGHQERCSRLVAQAPRETSTASMKGKRKPERAHVNAGESGEGGTNGTGSSSSSSSSGIAHVGMRTQFIRTLTCKTKRPMTSSVPGR